MEWQCLRFPWNYFGCDSLKLEVGCIHIIFLIKYVRNSYINMYFKCLMSSLATKLVFCVNIAVQFTRHMNSSSLTKMQLASMKLYNFSIFLWPPMIIALNGHLNYSFSMKNKWLFFKRVCVFSNCFSSFSTWPRSLFS